MILSISGFHGTGKSTIGKLIAESLGITYYSTGEAFRELAKEKEMTLAEFTEFVENHPNVDLELDEKIIEIAKKDNIVIDSQLSGFLLKDIADFKIHLVCPIDIRVKRMAARDQTSYKTKLKETALREKSELERFKKLYNIDLNNIKEVNETFDLIIDTENLTIEEVLKLILLKLKEYD
ncbi:MAG: cytidylate kinase family protein [Promethearchaeia archaeon]